MSNPRHMHKFWPNKKGKCKVIVGDSHCGKSETDIVHQRYEEEKIDCLECSGRGYFGEKGHPHVMHEHGQSCVECHGTGKKIEEVIKMSELRPCHSCGSKADDRYIEGESWDRVFCLNEECEYSKFAVSVKAWNTRTDPVKDELKDALIFCYKSMFSTHTPTKSAAQDNAVRVLEKATGKKIEEVI